MGANGLASLELQLDGALVGGTQSRASGQPVGSTTSLSSSGVINTGVVPGILTLVNDSGGPRDITGTNINIVKLQ